VHDNKVYGGPSTQRVYLKRAIAVLLPPPPSGPVIGRACYRAKCTFTDEDRLLVWKEENHENMIKLCPLGVVSECVATDCDRPVLMKRNCR
jgi:hypothetical protein